MICAALSYHSGYSQRGATYNTADSAALHQIPYTWQHYWNNHHMDSMGTLLCDNVDFINVAGNWLKGKNAVVADHKEKHQGIRFRNSSWQTDSVMVQYLTDDIAIFHIGWGLNGDFENETTPRPPHHGLFTWIVIRQNNKWLLKAVQNTNIKDSNPSK